MKQVAFQVCSFQLTWKTSPGLSPLPLKLQFSITDTERHTGIPSIVWFGLDFFFYAEQVNHLFLLGIY